ncbi:hypothetical protein MANES_05G116902v8 [Manihot esculenta]|uniref:Uncharacterized protein n=1 Tax=Manihot esculenta TaxID=3983 RepID=A0ACB7HPR2_MANES|nr:hypothetical protein MANES_05G116902v8 [Manihot esculenta]
MQPILYLEGRYDVLCSWMTASENKEIISSLFSSFIQPRLELVISSADIVSRCSSTSPVTSKDAISLCFWFDGVTIYCAIADATIERVGGSLSWARFLGSFLSFFYGFDLG